MNQALVMPTYDQQADCLDFFQEMILSGLSYWHEHAALQNMDVAVLDKERDSILSALSRGLEFDQAWPTVLKLIDKLASYMERRGYWTAWRAVLEQALATSQRVGDVAGETTMAALLARLSQRQSRGEDVVRYYRRAMRLAKRSDNQYEFARACCNLGYYYIEALCWWRAEVLSLRALEIFEALGNEHGRAHTHNHLGLLYVKQHSLSDAEKHLKYACDLWEDMRDKHGLMYGLQNLSYLYLESGRFNDAIIAMKKALHDLVSINDESGRAICLMNLGWAYAGTNQFELALSCSSQAETLFQKVKDGSRLASIRHNLGLISFKLQDFEEAIRFYLLALQQFQRRKDTYHESKVLYDIVEYYVAMGDQKNAKHYLNQINILLTNPVGSVYKFSDEQLQKLSGSVVGI